MQNGDLQAARLRILQAEKKSLEPSLHTCHASAEDTHVHGTSTSTSTSTCTSNGCSFSCSPSPSPSRSTSTSASTSARCSSSSSSSSSSSNFRSSGSNRSSTLFQQSAQQKLYIHMDADMHLVIQVCAREDTQARAKAIRGCEDCPDSQCNQGNAVASKAAMPGE